MKNAPEVYQVLIQRDGDDTHVLITMGDSEIGARTFTSSAMHDMKKFIGAAIISGSEPA